MAAETQPVLYSPFVVDELVDCVAGAEAQHFKLEIKLFWTQDAL
ncbi:11118_t:CDS:1, partial [Paraglomus brasilianum]